MLEGEEYVAGEITWVDFALAEFMQCLWLLKPSFLESFPNVWNHQKRIWDLPAIEAYHASGRYKEVPVNNPYARWDGL